jgi:hypothetical protein
MVSHGVRARFFAAGILHSAFLSMIALVLATFAIPGHAAVGRTPGTFSISSTGAANYTIPIWAPHGPNGLQPSIALVYSSDGGDGPLGVGWNISGLSSIYRCNQTYAQDAVPAPVSLATSDGYCLDGKRLRLTYGTYGAAGSTYQTEITDFSTATAEGAAGNGPSYFIVQARNGVKYYYGNSSDSQVLASGTALEWLLNEVVDPAGNTMKVAYNQSTGSAVPATIYWTPSSYGSTSYNYTMTFSYGANVPQSSVYKFVAGTPVVNTNLLNTITIAYNGATVKQYAMKYQPSPTTSRDELIQVLECADSAQSNCLSPTTISYQDGTPGISSTATTLSMGSAANWYQAHYDFNGDGYKDLIYQQAGTDTWYIAFGSANGYGAAVSTGITTAAYTPSKGTVLFGDLVGAGRDGILTNNGGTWYYYTWNGSGFSGVSTGLAYDTTATAFALVDTNGDGLPDLVELNESTGSAVVYIRLNSTSGSNPSFGAANVAFSYTPDSQTDVINGGFITQDSQQGGPIRYLDFNGDGRQDLVVTVRLEDIADKIRSTAQWWLLGNGTTFNTYQVGNAPSFFLNFNNDSCTDYVTGTTLVIAACNGTAATTVNLGYSPLTAIDWDGDGRTDLIYNASGYIGVQLSTGQGLATGFTTTIPWSSSALTYFGADVTGDGMDDLLVWQNDRITLNYYVHNSPGVKPDLLSSIRDGFGNSVSPIETCISK